MSERDEKDKELLKLEEMRVAYNVRKEWTYEDYLKIDDGNRYEIIDGNLYMMASPKEIHQSLLIELSIQIGTYLRGKSVGYM